MSKLSQILLVVYIGLTSAKVSAAMPGGMPESYMTECASCHTAYAPRFLNQQNWQNITNNLDKHFGTDASMDSKTLEEISKWLVKNAATKGKSAVYSPDNRITSKAWFKGEHDEVSTAEWKRPSIKGPSNCAACHTNANEGSFDEDDVRIPRK
jgi:nitrate/TMAO reductase-like tetraheme cytochrome c subunit